MELKPCITIILALLLLLVWPNLSQGAQSVANFNTEIYEIDYRGPETHSNVPPPNRLGGRPSYRRKRAMAHPKFKDLSDHKEESVHG